MKYSNSTIAFGTIACNPANKRNMSTMTRPIECNYSKLLWFFIENKIGEINPGQLIECFRSKFNTFTQIEIQYIYTHKAKSGLFSINLNS